MTGAVDLLREKCRLHRVDTTGCVVEKDYRQALNEQAPQWEQEEDAPRRRRAAADEGEKKRKSGKVEPSLETSSAKKPKELPKLCGCDEDGDGNKPSEELVDECVKVLQRNKETTTSKEVWDAVKERFKVTGKRTGGYGPRSCLADATLALAVRYGNLTPDEKKTSPLRWLDASGQQKYGGKRSEAAAAKKTEVSAMATEVAKAVGEGRVEPIKHEMGTTKGVALPATTIGLHGESKVVKKLRAATVGDALRWRYAPPWMTLVQVAAFWRVLAKVPLSTPLYNIVEGPKGGFGLPSVDFWLALHCVLAALAVLEPEFASLKPLLGYMVPVHVKTLQATFGPGGGDHADAFITSAVERYARRIKIQRSELVRGAGRPQRSGDHIYTPPNAPRDRLPGPNHGLRLNVAPVMKGGKFDVEAPFLGPTLSEAVDFGGNAQCLTFYTTAAAKDGGSLGVGMDVRNDVIFARDNAWDHDLAAVVLAGALNLGDLAFASSWVALEAFQTAPRGFIMEQYQPKKQVEFSEIMSVGVAIELATRCAMMPSDVRLEFDRKRTHDSLLVAAPDATVPLLRTDDARLEWKALTNEGERLKVVHGRDDATPGDARYCCLAIATDLGEGRSKIRAADAPFSEVNVAETLDMVHELLKALEVSHDREATFADFLKKSVILKRTRVAVCSISDLDKHGNALDAQVRRVSFDAPWPRVKADLRAALTYCLGRLDKWRRATPGAKELHLHGPRVPTGDPLKLVQPTGVAADITTAAAPPPALKRKAGVGGLAPVPPPPKLHPSEPRPVPWKECVEECTAAPRKKKARKK